MESLQPRLGEDRSSLVGGPAGLHHDPHEIVRHVHERVHHAGQVQSLESPHIGRSHHYHSPRVLDAELEPLLFLDPLDDPVSLHDLHRVRVRPRPDSDPVPSNHDPAVRARGYTGRSVRRRKFGIRGGRSGV